MARISTTITVPTMLRARSGIGLLKFRLQVSVAVENQRLTPVPEGGWPLAIHVFPSDQGDVAELGAPVRELGAPLTWGHGGIQTVG